jgi:uncharacterized protein with FMN-binding domain
MRGSHIAVIVGGCATLVAAGFAAAPPLTVTAQPGPVPSTDPTTDATAGPTAGPGAETFAGPAVQNERGTYQAQITVVDGVVTDVVALQAGTTAAQSLAVNAMAIPEFKSRVLEAQTWDVDAVSGASFTSPAFLESLQGAFAEAGLPS